MKTHDSVYSDEKSCLDAAINLIKNIPSIENPSEIYHQSKISGYVIDASFEFDHCQSKYTLIIEVISRAEPRQVRNRAYKLKSCIADLVQSGQIKQNHQYIPMVVSDYLSPESRRICFEHKLAYLDLQGNASLVFDNVYIEKSTATKPKAETRTLKSLFSPKAGAILRVLLNDPGNTWRMANLATEARASLGHVSNVRKILLDREWIEIRKEGIVLIQPDSLLNSWRENYRQPSGEILKGYTTLHGDQLINQLTGTLGIEQESPLAILSSNSAAQWLAPYLRDFTQTFYADKFGADILEKKLDLKRTESGANVIIHILKDDCYFDGAIQPKPGIYCTAPILTYLDLWNGNDRSREAADFMAGKYFPWL